MIKFLISLLFSLGLAGGYHLLAFGTTYSIRNTSDAFFVVGLLLFFMSLIAITDAAKVFIGFGYTFKNMFKKHRNKYSSYVDYANRKNAKEGNTFGLGTLLISILFLTISFILAHQYLN